MKYLILFLLIALIPVISWSHPQLYPIDKRIKMQAQQTGEWKLTTINDEGIFYVVSSPEISGQYTLSFDGSTLEQALLQFDTNIGSSSNISSVSLSRTLNSAGGNYDYYLGTWAATPPVEDSATFNGGTIAGGETSAEITDTIELDTSLINKTGITSLRIIQYGGTYFSTMSNVILTILYTNPTPSSKKLPFVAMP